MIGGGGEKGLHRREKSKFSPGRGNQVLQGRDSSRDRDGKCHFPPLLRRKREQELSEIISGRRSQRRGKGVIFIPVL